MCCDSSYPEGRIRVSENENNDRERRFSSIESAVESARAAGARVGFPRTAKGDQAAGSPRVTIVIPVFNQAEMTEKCLFAVAENTGDDPDYGVVVVDNGSTDWTMYLLHAMEGDVRVLNNERNEGFARACNKGAGAVGKAQDRPACRRNCSGSPCRPYRNPGWWRGTLPSKTRSH